MHILRNTFDRFWAALIFFTRLPFWRLHEPPQEAYRAVVEFWPLAGWVSAGVMAGVLYGSSLVFGYEIAVVLAITSRLMLTGALHEDGLADFFDGFGGGRDRQRILDIMKDSRIGTFGVLALVLYLLMLWTALCSMQPADAALTILAADPFAKMLSAVVIQTMPYARTAETAKNKTVYRKFSIPAGMGLLMQGLLPLAFYVWKMQGRIEWSLFIILPCLTMGVLYFYVWRKLRGYTGDCCGAIFLLTELTAYLVASYYLA
ncbi:MAG: adenosylcobinamide-GDP ribazoletransferase [Bacteroidaceae bacterium]|nr:adenosylcobinamide-GDP ribazoletransferase [Bacteroidaceae bacterium]